MGALKDLLASERGLVSLALIIAATVLASTGAMTVELWVSYTVQLAALFMGSKAITGAAEALASKRSPAPPSDAK